MEIYICFFYWAFSATGTTAYGDMNAETPVEKTFQSICLLLYKMYMTFVVAQFSNAITSANSARFDYNQKLKTWDGWLTLHKISGPVVSKIKKYHQILWQRFGGLDENSILADLPPSVQFEIRVFLLQE